MIFEVHSKLINNNINNEIMMHANIDQCVKHNDTDTFTVLLTKYANRPMTQIRRTKRNMSIICKCIQFSNMACIDIFIKIYPHFLKRIICSIAAEVGNVLVLDHMIKKYRCKWSAKNLILASANGHLNVLEYGLRENLSRKREARKIPDMAFYNALKYDHFECFDFLASLGPSSREMFLRDDYYEFYKLLSEKNDMRYVNSLHVFEFKLSKTLYHWAVLSNNAELILYLLTAKIHCDNIIYNAVYNIAYEKIGIAADSESYRQLDASRATNDVELNETYEYIYTNISDILAQFF